MSEYNLSSFQKRRQHWSWFFTINHIIISLLYLMKQISLTGFLQNRCISIVLSFLTDTFLWSSISSCKRFHSRPKTREVRHVTTSINYPGLRNKQKLDFCCGQCNATYKSVCWSVKLILVCERPFMSLPELPSRSDGPSCLQKATARVALKKRRPELPSRRDGPSCPPDA